MEVFQLIISIIFVNIFVILDYEIYYLLTLLLFAMTMAFIHSFYEEDNPHVIAKLYKDVWCIFGIFMILLLSITIFLIVIFDQIIAPPAQEMLHTLEYYFGKNQEPEIFLKNHQFLIDIYRYSMYSISVIILVIDLLYIKLYVIFIIYYIIIYKMISVILGFGWIWLFIATPLSLLFVYFTSKRLKIKK